jgi:hypothetical protein
MFYSKFYSKIGYVARQFMYVFKIKIDKTTNPAALSNFFKKIKPVKCKNLIRIGGQSDGGYLVPDDLEGINECYSPGVSSISNFENELSNLGIVCHMADFSVNGPALHNPLFVFRKKFLGLVNNDMFMRLDDWVSETSNTNNDLILQMDIEGAEWSVLNATHPNNVSKVIHCNGFSVPSVMEFTFLRKDRLDALERNYTFPNDLDAPNVSSLADYPLPDCWFR